MLALGQIAAAGVFLEKRFEGAARRGFRLGGRGLGGLALRLLAGGEILDPGEPPGNPEDENEHQQQHEGEQPADRREPENEFGCFGRVHTGKLRMRRAAEKSEKWQ